MNEKEELFEEFVDTMPVQGRGDQSNNERSGTKMENWEGVKKEEGAERQKKLKEDIEQWNCHIATRKANEDAERQTRTETAIPDREETEIPKG